MFVGNAVDYNDIYLLMSKNKYNLNIQSLFKLSNVFLQVKHLKSITPMQLITIKKKFNYNENRVSFLKQCNLIK